MGDVKCHYCSRGFPNEGALGTHMKWKHNQHPSQSLTCDQCGKVFKYLSKLRFHISRKHSESPFQRQVTKKSEANPFACLYCNFISYTKIELYQHYSNVHGQDMTEYRLNFPNVEAFETWKTSFSKEQSSWFINTGGWPKKDGTKCMVFKCHRDGFYKPNGQNKRLIKALGSYKINGHCTAHIKAYFGPLGVDVTYIKTHVGHDTDIKHLKLTQAERDSIASKLFSKVPMDTVLDNIKDSITNNELQRIHLLTRKDLYNVSANYGFNKDSLVNRSNGESIESWVQQMNSSTTAVRYFKPEGKADYLYPKEDFFLVLMSDAQLDMIRKYINGVVCIDNISGTSQTDYNLYSIIVLDNLKQSFPCAFMFSNRSDVVAVELFFQTIKNDLQDIVVSSKIFMSDPDDKYYNSWISIMGSVATRIICPWHLEHLWMINLSKIKNKDKRLSTFESIKKLQMETDYYSYDLSIAVTLYNLANDEDTKQFAEYFEQFRTDPTTWAHCYWQNTSELESKMHSDNIHVVLRQIIAKNKSNQTMDKVLSALMKFIREKLVNQLIISNKVTVTSKLSDIWDRHKASLVMASNYIVDQGSCWQVPDIELEGMETVSKLNPECDCVLRCAECNVCIHSYCCTCADSTMKWNMCKHIHFVCRFLPFKNKNNAKKSDVSNKLSQVENIKDKAIGNDNSVLDGADVKRCEIDTPVLNEASVLEIATVSDNASELLGIKEIPSKSVIGQRSSDVTTSSVSNPSDKNDLPTISTNLKVVKTIQPMCDCSLICTECSSMIHAVICKLNAVKNDVSPQGCKHKKLMYLPKKIDHNYCAERKQTTLNDSESDSTSSKLVIDQQLSSALTSNIKKVVSLEKPNGDSSKSSVIVQESDIQTTEVNSVELELPDKPEQENSKKRSEIDLPKVSRVTRTSTKRAKRDSKDMAGDNTQTDSEEFFIEK